MTETQVLTRREARAQQELQEVAFTPPPSFFGAGGFGSGVFGAGIEIDVEPEEALVEAVESPEEAPAQVETFSLHQSQEQWGEEEPFLMGDTPVPQSDPVPEVEPVPESEPSPQFEQIELEQWDAEPATEMLIIAEDHDLYEFPDSFVEKVVNSMDESMDRVIPESFDELITGTPLVAGDVPWHSQHSATARPWWDTAVPVGAVIFWVLLVTAGLGVGWMLYTGEAIPFLPADLGDGLLGLVGQ